MHHADQEPEILAHNTIQDFIKLSKLLSDHKYTVLKPNTIDMVAILLLAAAINEELFYDVVAWGEHTRLASKATFSRRKDFLENMGVIYEENVRAPYGRPGYASGSTTRSSGRSSSSTMSRQKRGSRLETLIYRGTLK